MSLASSGDAWNQQGEATRRGPQQRACSASACMLCMRPGQCEDIVYGQTVCVLWTMARTACMLCAEARAACMLCLRQGLPSSCSPRVPDLQRVQMPAALQEVQATRYSKVCRHLWGERLGALLTHAVHAPPKGCKRMLRAHLCACPCARRLRAAHHPRATSICCADTAQGPQACAVHAPGCVPMRSPIESRSSTQGHKHMLCAHRLRVANTVKVRSVFQCTGAHTRVRTAAQTHKHNTYMYIYARTRTHT